MSVTTKYGEMTKPEAIKTILEDYPNDIGKAMEECFRDGFLRGEAYTKDYYKEEISKYHQYKHLILANDEE
ncbi:hypothetical protein [Anaerovorax sp. IOR16]|uniref:hypothetical protein n=1 Tax=Anaerovorax sp. IOR16 TaxID=2773458 RepID=UPI0019D127BE|nr:hypothetical protein [Anaerovorax sp. IOR16]